MVATSRAKAAIAHSMKMSGDLLKSSSLDGDDRLTTHETCCLLTALRMQAAESKSLRSHSDDNGDMRRVATPTAVRLADNS
jgi:hypothetical protein